MTVEKMTVHKALAELKLLDKRIVDAIAESQFCTPNRASNKKIGGVEIDEAKAAMKSHFQSCQDLIKRQIAIKKAVILSNASVKVTINGLEYTKAEAIAMHNQGMEYKNALLMQLSNQYRRAQSFCDQHNADLPEEATRDAERFYANDTSDDKAEKIKKAIDDRIADGTYSIISGIDMTGEIEKLKAEIDAFMTEVDAALSVSNAVTEIEVEY